MKCSVKKAAGTAQIAEIRSFHFNYKTIHWANCCFNCFKQENYIQMFENSFVYLLRILKLNRTEGKLLQSASNSHQGESNNFKCWIKNKDMTNLQQVFGTKAYLIETLKVYSNPAELLKQAPPKKRLVCKSCSAEKRLRRPAASCSLIAIIIHKVSMSPCIIDETRLLCLRQKRMCSNPCR